MKRILKVQQNIGKLSKKSENPFFKSAYLDLNDLLTHVTPLLNAEGLVIVQPILDNKVCSRIIDSKDDKVIAISEIELPTITDPQKLGSCITYFRRYTLKSLLAIAEGDDDGNLAAKPEPQKDPTEKDILKLISDAGSNDDLAKIKAWIKHFKLDDIAVTKSKQF